MNYTQITDERSDATASYEVKIDKNMTVKDLTEMIVRESIDRFGVIEVFNGSAPSFGIGKCTEAELAYRNGKLTGGIGYSTAQGRKVTKVIANGGWGRLDYYVSTEESDEV